MNYQNNMRPNVTPLAQGQQQFNFSQFQSQPIFPQPSGNIYFVNNSLEVANIPIGAGMSAVLCLPENLFYIKSMQNGTPSLLGYKISPLEPPTTMPEEDREDSTVNTTTEESVVQNEFQKQLEEMAEKYEQKIKSLEASIEKLQDKVGGLIECQF